MAADVGLSAAEAALWWVIGGALAALAVALGAGILGVLGLEAVKLAKRRSTMAR